MTLPHNLDLMHDEGVDTSSWGMTLREMHFDVMDFHQTFGHPINIRPTLQPEDRAHARADWLIEEANELKEAKTIAEQADAYIDSIYFAIGGLVELGVVPNPLWKAVQAANMAKVWPDGTVHRNEIGKVLKPDGWSAPNIEALVQEQIDAQH